MGRAVSFDFNCPGSSRLNAGRESGLHARTRFSCADVDFELTSSAIAETYGGYRVSATNLTPAAGSYTWIDRSTGVPSTLSTERDLPEQILFTPCTGPRLFQVELFMSFSDGLLCSKTKFVFLAFDPNSAPAQIKSPEGQSAYNALTDVGSVDSEVLTGGTTFWDGEPNTVLNGLATMGCFACPPVAFVLLPIQGGLQREVNYQKTGTVAGQPFIDNSPFGTYTLHDASELQHGTPPETIHVIPL